MIDTTAPSRARASSSNAKSNASDERPAAQIYSPVKVRRVFEEVCQQIRARIADDLLKPGDKLPAERVLAEQFGVGRAAVREALRSLESSGIIRLQKGVQGGAFIQHVSPETVSTSMRDMVHLGKASLDNLVEARTLLSDVTIPLVCVRATERDFAAMEENVDRSDKSSDLAERLRLTAEFYRLLGTASHNEFLRMLLESLTEVVVDFAKAWQGAPISDVPAERRKLVEYLREKNVDAAVALSRHMLEKMHALLLTAYDDG